MSGLDLICIILLVSSFAIVAYAYLGYPVLIWGAALAFGRRQERPPMDEAELPTLSLLIAAYNEESQIGGRIENALEMDYPAAKLQIVVASDGSTDRTNEIVRGFERFRVRLLAFPQRRGKANVLNEAIPLLSGEIVMLSDANTFTH